MSQMCRMCIRGAMSQNVTANNFVHPLMYLDTYVSTCLYFIDAKVPDL